MHEIVADGHGGFIIGEPNTVPVRFARFDRDGEVQYQWYGGQTFFTWAEPDPRDPTQVWFNSSNGVVHPNVDYEAGDWRVVETCRLNGVADGLITGISGIKRMKVRYHNGDRYLISEYHPPTVLGHEDGSLTPVAVGGDDKTTSRSRAKEIAGGDGKFMWFRWADANGDGKPQTGEIESSAWCASSGVDTDWELLFGRSADTGVNFFRERRSGAVRRRCMSELSSIRWGLSRSKPPGGRARVRGRVLWPPRTATTQ